MTKHHFLPSAQLAALLLACLLLTFSRCRDGRDFIADAPRVSATFTGQVIDENKQPVAGALVELGDVSGRTDHNGVFRLPATLVPRYAAVLHVTMQGYFAFHRAYSVEPGALRTVTVQLLQRQYIGQLDIAQGGMLQVGQTTLDFPPGAVEGTSGNIAYVYARYLDPTAPNLRLCMPGDLRGITAGGEEHVLVTFGMLGVEIEGPGGEKLEIADCKDVELTWPVAPTQVASAPASIPLWHFDPDRAEWIEEGAADRVGDWFVARVKHFSWWNCDISGPRINLEGRVYLDDLQHPLANVVVNCLSPSGAFGGLSDATGYFGGPVPKDVQMQLVVSINGQCGQLYTTTIGPFASDVVLPPIVIATANLANFARIDGRLVGCDQQPVAGGYITVKRPGAFLAYPTDSDGKFVLVNDMQCTTGPGIEITGYDPATFNTSAALNVTWQAGVQPLGDLPVCTAADEFIMYSIDGQHYEALAVYQTLDGGHTYLHSQGATNAFSMGFANNGQTGNFPVDFLYTTALPGLDSLSQVSVTTTVTQYGPVGDLILGSFNGQLPATNGSNHTISGTYRVRREQ